jgi:hypothetical protein
MKYVYDMYSYLIFAHKDLTEDYFLQKAGVVDGYAKELFMRIYKSLMAESEDVSHLYETFYKTEYSSLSEFLEKYYCLERKYVDEIMSYLENNPQVKLYDYNSLSVGENFDDFIYSETVYERFQQLLLMEK